MRRLRGRLTSSDVVKGERHHYVRKLQSVGLGQESSSELHCWLRHSLVHVTTIVPCIFGCSEQKYVYVPGLPSVALYR
jgi:hypothetical protein